MFINLKDMHEDCVEQLKSRHVYLNEDTKRGWHCKDGSPTNLLIEGENYHALRMLEYTHMGKVDVIYIDPPYNTGNKDFVYSDDFSDVPDGDEGDIPTGTLKYVNEEDPCRHSKWASFMVRRLRIARNLLSERGVIFISIDDREMAYCKLLCDAVFGEDNFLANIIWDKRNSKGNVNHFACIHEYVLVYAKDVDSVPKLLSKKANAEAIIQKAQELFKTRDLEMANSEFRKWLKKTEFSNGEKAYDKIDANGRVWRSVTLTAPGSDTFYDVIHPITKKPCKTESRGWGCKESVMIERIKNGEVLFGKDETTVPNRIYYLDEFMFQAPTTIYSSAANGVDDLPPDMTKIFDYPKPVSLIKWLVSIASDKKSIILDFFGGSGTTGQAVVELNREDGGTRQFILVTNNEKSDKLPNGIARDVTYPRLERTIKSDTNLSYMKVHLRKHEKTTNTCTKVAQLEVDNRLLPLLKVRFNAYNEIERTDRYVILQGQDNFYAGIYFNHTGSPNPLGAVRRSFQSHVDSISENNEVLFNIPSGGYTSEYFNFIQATNPKE